MILATPPAARKYFVDAIKPEILCEAMRLEMDVISGTIAPPDFSKSSLTISDYGTISFTDTPENRVMFAMIDRFRDRVDPATIGMRLHAIHQVVRMKAIAKAGLLTFGKDGNINGIAEELIDVIATIRLHKHKRLKSRDILAAIEGSKGRA